MTKNDFVLSRPFVIRDVELQYRSSANEVRIRYKRCIVRIEVISVSDTGFTLSDDFQNFPAGKEIPFSNFVLS